MADKNEFKTKEKMFQLWIHEMLRVFHDRLINDHDKTYFKEMITEIMHSKNTYYNNSYTYQDLFINQHLIFGDFIKVCLLFIIIIERVCVCVI